MNEPIRSLNQSFDVDEIMEALEERLSLELLEERLELDCWVHCDVCMLVCGNVT